MENIAITKRITRNIAIEGEKAEANCVTAVPNIPIKSIFFLPNLKK